MTFCYFFPPAFTCVSYSHYPVEGMNWQPVSCTCQNDRIDIFHCIACFCSSVMSTWLLSIYCPTMAKKYECICPYNHFLANQMDEFTIYSWDSTWYTPRRHLKNARCFNTLASRIVVVCHRLFVKVHPSPKADKLLTLLSVWNADNGTSPETCNQRWHISLIFFFHICII